MILRCAPAVDGGVLFVDGASTYAGIRLDSWQADYRRHRGRRLSSSATNGAFPSGLLKVPQDGTSSATEPSSVARSSRSSAAHAETINDNNKGIDKKKAAAAAAAAIVGLATTGAKLAFSFSGTASGCYVNFAYGACSVKAGWATATVATVGSAAGSALILGAAVGTSRILHSLGRLDELPSSRTVLALGYDQRSVGKIAIPGAGMVRNPKHKAEHREP